jgi:IclR family transcriptional regulator, KDG regulon repressor
MRFHNMKESKLMATSPNGSIRSLDKAMDILDLLATEPHGLALSEIARRLHFNESTTHHLIATLKRRGVIDQDPRTRSYRLGFGLIQMALRFLGETDLYAAAERPIRELRDASGETAYLTVLHGHDLVSVIEMLGARPIQARRFIPPGQTCLHSTASGKLWLAFLPPDQLAPLLASLPLPRFTPNTIDTREALEAELAAIRRQGYALDREENLVGVTCVAAPVFARHGQCVAIASIAFPAPEAGRFAEFVELVTETGRKISTNLGYVPARPGADLVGVSSSAS